MLLVRNLSMWGFSLAVTLVSRSSSISEMPTDFKWCQFSDTERRTLSWKRVFKSPKCLVGKQTNSIYFDVFILGTQAQRFKGAKFKFVSKVAYRLLFSYLRNRLLDIEMDICVCLNHLMPFFQACVDRNIPPILIKGKSSFLTKFVNWFLKVNPPSWRLKGASCSFLSGIYTVFKGLKSSW